MRNTIDERKESIKDVKDFFEEIQNICLKYELSISHEDFHGGFIIESYDEKNIDWLKAARIETDN